MSLVLHSSATLAWLYSDEITAAIRRVFESVAEHGAVVPALWRLEIANSLTVGVRRGRIDTEFRRAALSDLAMLAITPDPHTDSNAWGETLHLADQCGLTSPARESCSPSSTPWSPSARTGPLLRRDVITPVGATAPTSPGVRREV